VRALLTICAVLALEGGCRCRKDAKIAGDCATQLPAAQGAIVPPDEPTQPPLETSRIAFSVVVPLATMRKSIEAKVPVRVAEESNRDIGTAGKLSYTVDRTPFVISVNQGRVILKSDLTAQVHVCKPLGPLGCQEYASCTPTMRFEASVPIALAPTWTVAPSTVRIDVVKGCVVTPLGMVSVDVTPTIEARLATEAKKAQARIDKSVPPFRADVEKGWEKMQGSLPVAGTSCARLNPIAILQGPAKIEDDKLIARGCIDAMPSVDTPCPEPQPKPVALPNVTQDLAIPESLVLHVPVRLSIAQLSEEWSKRVEGPLTVGEESLRIGALTVRVAREGIVIDAAVSGTTCGVLSLLAVPSWDEKRRLLVLSSLTPRTTGPHLQAIADALRAKLEMPLPLDSESMAKVIGDLKPVLPGEGPALDLVMGDRKCERVVWTKHGVEARFELKGSVKISLK